MPLSNADTPKIGAGEIRSIDYIPDFEKHLDGLVNLFADRGEQR
jgi:hypothetical protein